MEKMLTKNDILTAISNMSVLELVELIEEAEKKFKVSSLSFADTINKESSTAVDTTIQSSDKKEQIEFKLFLKDIGLDKIKVIKVVRSITKLGLKESKELVESSVPILVKDKLSKEEANDYKKEFESVGAVAVLE